MPNKTHKIFLPKKTEGIFSILIKKHLWRVESKFKKSFRLSRDQFTYILNIIEKDTTTITSIRFSKPTAAEKLAVT